MKIAKLTSILYMVLLGGLFGVVSGIHPAATIAGVTTAVYVIKPAVKYIALKLNISATLQPGILATSIDITELATKLGAYCQEHRDILISEILLNENFEEKFEILDDITDELPLPSLNMTSIVKPANPITFAPTANALAFGARVLKVRGCKVDLQLVPQVLEKTWLGKMKNPNDPWDMPFEAFIFKYIIEKAREDIHLNGVFRGVYNAGGATPVDTMDGFLELIADEIVLGMVPIVTGAITDVNVVASLLAVYDALGEAYKNKPTIMKVNAQIFDWYSRKFAPVLNTSLVATDVAAGLMNPLLRQIPLSGSNAILQREPGLGTSQRVMVSPKENFVYGCDTLNNFSFDVQKFDRTIKILIDFKAGVNFKEVHSRALAVNDQV